MFNFYFKILRHFGIICDNRKQIRFIYTKLIRVVKLRAACEKVVSSKLVLLYDMKKFFNSFI